MGGNMTMISVDTTTFERRNGALHPRRPEARTTAPISHTPARPTRPPAKRVTPVTPQSTAPATTSPSAPAIVRPIVPKSAPAAPQSAAPATNQKSPGAPPGRAPNHPRARRALPKTPAPSVAQSTAPQATPAAPTPPATPPESSTVETKRRRSLEQQANVAKNAILPAALVSAMGLDQYVEIHGYRHYLDGVIRDAGNPTDPVEIMLIEQMAVCHLRAAQLQGRAGEAHSLDAGAIYNTAAARLTAEFRKLALALKEYRRR